MGRVGWKRSDRRWEAEGQVWDSKLEYQVYAALRASGVDVERCGEGDSFDYVEPVHGGGLCLACGSDRCVQKRIYTPDLRISVSSEQRYRYVEVKGHFPKDKRALFRHFRKSNPDADVVFVLGADHWVTKGKSRLSDYFARYLKTTPFIVVNPKQLENGIKAARWSLKEFVLEPS